MTTDRMRHRDRLLSLKYSTIEACFSVPMLNLTLPSFPFVLAFAVKGLGWSAATVGLIASLPHVCNCLQPLILSLLSRRLSLYQILSLTFTMGAVPWMLAVSLPSLRSTRDWIVLSILVLATLANSISSVAWSTAISEVVPERLGGRYFARRNLIFGAWTLAAVLVAGHMASWQNNSLQVFGWIFLVAGTLRLAGLFFLRRMRFPGSVAEVRPRGVVLKNFLAVFKDRNYLRLCVFIGLWGLLLNAAMPFYTVFLVGRLQFGLGHVMTLTTLSSLGGLVTLQGWGKLSERFGNRPVLQVCAMIWAMTAMGIWALARPGFTWHLYFGYFIIGAMTAGFQLLQFNLMVRLAPGVPRPAYVAVFLAFTSFLTAFGPIFGGQLIRLLPADAGQMLGRPVYGYHLLFVLAALGCLLVSTLVQRVTEPAAATHISSVWREMSTMRTFNPMLSILAVAELMLTPRGLFALGRRSLRSVRQQVKALEDVGEEFVEGGKQIFTSAIGKPGQEDVRGPKSQDPPGR